MMSVRCKGIILIETLIALSLIGLGILSISYFVLQGKQDSLASENRLRIIYITQDLLGKMQSTPLNITNYYQDLDGMPDTTAEPVCAIVNNCTTGEIISIHIWQFEQQLNSGFAKVNGNALISSSAQACIAAGTDGTLISVYWQGFSRVRAAAITKCASSIGIDYHLVEVEG